MIDGLCGESSQTLYFLFPNTTELSMCQFYQQNGQIFLIWNFSLKESEENFKEYFFKKTSY